LADIVVPEDLTAVVDADLTALSDSIRAEAEAVGADAANSDEALAQVEMLVADFDRVNNEIKAREMQRQDRADRVAAALGKLSEPVPDMVPDMGEVVVTEPMMATEVVAEFTAVETPVVDPEPVVEVEATVAPEATAELQEEEAVVEVVEVVETVEVIETVEVEVEAVEAAVVEVEAVEVVAEVAAAPVVEAAVVVPAEDIVSEVVEESTIELSTEVSGMEDSSSLTGAEASSALTRLVPDGVAPIGETVSTGAALHASNAVPGISEGTALDRMELATAITKKRHGMNNASSGSYERIVLATAQSDLPNKVAGGAEENFSVFDTVRTSWALESQQRTSLVASGGNCAPLPPSYEFFRLAEQINPVEQALPTVEAPRGGIRFITPPDWTDALAGVRVTTEAEDAAGYGDASGLTAPKPCVHVDCPPIEECRVDAVSQCVEFGNLNYRVFPEQVAAFLEDLAVAFTSTKEIFYLDAIDATSTAVTLGYGGQTYGATRTSTLSILSLAANYRRRQHMAINAVLTLMLPSWYVEFIKSDMVNDHALGMSFLNAGEAEVTAWLASNNLDVVWYYDSATGAGQAFNDAQGANAQNMFPATVVAYLFAPGTYVRLDGGTLDVGIVRDSILNGTNDLQIFSEQWVQVCQVGLESIRLELELCPTGVGPVGTSDYTDCSRG
jgi:hypothetical protein